MTIPRLSSEQVEALACVRGTPAETWVAEIDRGTRAQDACLQKIGR